MCKGVILHPLDNFKTMDLIHSSGKTCLSTLHKEEKEELYKSSEILMFSAGELVVKSGTPVHNLYFIKSGIVELSLNQDSKKQALNLLFQGDFIGINCVYSTSSYRFSAKALTECEIEIINRDIFSDLLQRNKDFAMAFIQYISWVNENFINWHMKLREKNSAGALAFLICEFQKSLNQNTFDIPLTRQDMARIIGFSKESVLKNLASFRKEKIIESEGKSIRIIDSDRLNNIAKHG